MDMSLKSILLFLTILCTGMTAGLCFTWTNAITPGIGKLNDFDFLQSFQIMNRAIINLPFLILFFSPFFLHFLNAYVNWNERSSIFWLSLIAMLIFVIGVIGITILKNIPLNEMLDEIELGQASEHELSEFRIQFEASWNLWHFVRTTASFISFSLLLLSILFTK